MPNYRRTTTPGGTYFFTVNTFRRQTFLTDEDVRLALREGIELARRTRPFTIDAWVLLPDHLHCLWTLPLGDADFSSRWGIIKRTVTKRCGARLNRPEWLDPRRLQRHQSSLWQPRFWEHQIRDSEDFNRHADDIHWNPVKHGYVQRAADWAFSSFNRFVAKGLYSKDWGSTIAIDRSGDFGELAE